MVLCLGVLFFQKVGGTYRDYLVAIDDKCSIADDFGVVERQDPRCAEQFHLRKITQDVSSAQGDVVGSWDVRCGDAHGLT